SAQYRHVAGITGSVLLSYWTAPQRSYVWLITNKDISAFTLPAETKIAPLVERHRAVIENLHDPLAIEDTSGGELYQALIAPLRHRIPNDSRILIVPDGPLYALNVDTLQLA